MDPTDDKKTASTEVADEASKQQFLDALLAAGHESNPSDFNPGSLESDGVALSSNPDPVDLPGVPAGPVNSRPDAFNRPNKPQIMYSIERGFPNEDADEPVMNETETTSAEVEKKTGEDTGLLLLSCPKCGGELALHEEHVGIEGACVWCNAPIVAGRAGGNRAVKVFAIATETVVNEAPPASEEKAFHDTPDHQTSDFSQPEESIDFTEGDMPAGWGAPTPNEKDALPSGPVEEPEASTPPDEPVETPESDIPTGWGAPTPIDRKTETEETESPQETSPAPASQQSEDPAPGEGFGTALEAPNERDSDKDISQGFSSSSHDSEEEFAPEPSSHNSGFGEFLSSASGAKKAEFKPESAVVEEVSSTEQPQREDFSSPTPWGPPVQPTENESPSPATDEAPGLTDVEDDSSPFEFREPTGKDSPPDEATAKDFAPSPDHEDPATVSPISPSDKALGPSTGFGAAADFDGAPATLANDKPETTIDPERIPDALFSPSTPSQDKPDEAEEDFPVGFNIPSSEPASSPFPSFGPTDGAPEPIEETSKPKTSTDDSLPVFEANEESAPSHFDSAPATESLFGNPSQGSSSLFGPAPESAKVPAAESTSNLFGEEKAGEESKGSSKAKPKQPDSAAPAPAAQQVDSVILGKKKRGKGFFIITAIILGLVCGAALASFVLPVDEYVDRARSIMEQKFMPSATWESAENNANPEQPSPELDN